MKNVIQIELTNLLFIRCRIISYCMGTIKEKMSSMRDLQAATKKKSKRKKLCLLNNCFNDGNLSDLCNVEVVEYRARIINFVFGLNIFHKWRVLWMRFFVWKMLVSIWIFNVKHLYNGDFFKLCVFHHFEI